VIDQFEDFPDFGPTTSPARARRVVRVVKVEGGTEVTTFEPDPET
jgi:hypothetical protein